VIPLVITRLISVQQRLKTLTEFRTMSIAPFPIPVLRDSKWSVLQSDELLPGDVISLGTCFVFIARLQRILTQSSAQSPVRNEYPRGHSLGSRDMHR
jgi:magnesium-transporting ATPase (P-type)